MKPIVLIALAPLALTACNMGKVTGTTGSGNNSSIAAVPVTPDAVIVNGVTYVRAGGPPGGIPVPAATVNPLAPAAISTPALPIPNDTTTSTPTNVPPTSSAQPDGVSVTGGH